MTEAPPVPAIRTATFGDLDTTTLYAILALRSQVFVVEQQCAYRDLDHRDTEPDTHHLWIEDDDGGVAAYLRTVGEDNGVTRIGRVVTDSGARGQGLAGHLVRHVLATVPGAIAADAQAYLTDWYRGLGFAVTGPSYVEDGIAHVPMAAPAERSGAAAPADGAASSGRGGGTVAVARDGDAGAVDQVGGGAPKVDALRVASDASYEAQLAREPIHEAEAQVAAEMIGRPLRGESAAAVRCAWGLPAVLRVQPRLADGTPFPTTFWLSCPLASKHIGGLEASGIMRTMTDRLAEDPALAEAYEGAHQRYVAMRDQLGSPLPRDASAGGMPVRVKCLHALYAHHLATDDNPIGAWVGEQIEPMTCPAPCVGTVDG